MRKGTEFLSVLAFLLALLGAGVAVRLAGALWAHPEYGLLLAGAGYGLTALSGYQSRWTALLYGTCALAVVHAALALVSVGRWLYLLVLRLA